MSAVAPPSGGPMVRFASVSKFYGDVLGVNRVTLDIGPGITSLVGPNGAGKTTLMNLMTGLIRPTRGRLWILGVSPDRPGDFLAQVGYCSQYDSFPLGMTGREFVAAQLALQGYARAGAAALAERALRRVEMLAAADRPLAAYSKGMRQRLRLAQATAHDPQVVILDEPLNGLDPLARAESAALFRALAAEGRCLIVSSHILHEVDRLSDRVILMQNGYVVGDGSVPSVREEIREHPLQVLVRCDRPEWLAARLFAEQRITEAQLAEARGRVEGVFVKTRDPAAFFLFMNQIAAAGELQVETVAPVDDNLDAVYRFLLQGGQA